MNNRNILKILLVVAMYVFSCIFIYSNKLLWVYETNNWLYINLLPIILPVNIFLLKKKNKFIIIFSVINGLFLGMEIINMVMGYFEYGSVMIEYFYLVVISYVLISSILNFRKNESVTNDLLMCGISFLVIVIHMRYYFDNSFLHNLLNITDRNSIILQNSYNYVTSYYVYFIIMFLVVLVNQRFDRL